jgi:hypothetical protein
MFVTNQQSAELPKPRIGSLHNPAAEIVPQPTELSLDKQMLQSAIRKNSLSKT